MDELSDLLRRSGLSTGLVTALCLFIAACDRVDLPDESAFAAKDFGELGQPDCYHRVANKQALFGDVHVHTAKSSDAWNFGVRVAPRDAYAYAFGQEITLPGTDEGAPRKARIDRPLDFVAITDHAEFLAEQEICNQPQSAGYHSDFCAVMRSGEGRAPALVARIISPFSRRDAATCGADGAECARYGQSSWADTIAAAQVWDDASPDCERTTFVAYEYSSFRLGSNLHRNVIFRNAIVPQHPISYLEAHREWDLWRILDDRCNTSGSGCEALAIPHNSNISNGRMFAQNYPGAETEQAQRQRATLRAKMEPLVEVMQHKGDSECRNDLPGVLGGNDELCDFEKFENLTFLQRNDDLAEVSECYTGPLADWKPHLGPSCLHRNSYVRYALVSGMQEQQRIGVNPFKLGIVASTDTHNGLAGGVQEADYKGHLGTADATVAQRVSLDSAVAGNASNNPGGLIGVWATQNNRDAIFDAMQQREVFGTSGPRIQPRFFASWGFEQGLCDRPDAVEKAYQQGVPMGSDLPVKTGDKPQFLLMAQADAGTADYPGAPLQELQLIKAWADEAGRYHQRVVTVAGKAMSGLDGLPTDCNYKPAGETRLCALWQDDEFNANTAAVYYLRAVEVPSCRYSARQCQQLPESQRPDSCASDLFSPMQQERAWSSPVWYTPTG